MRRVAVVVIVLAIAVLLAWIRLVGTGRLGTSVGPGQVAEATRPTDSVAERAAQQRATARLAGVAEPKQILFGDLHVHSTYSTDAFMMSLPLAGGDGVRPVADACDYARFCSQLDFWSINDHALALTPERWDGTLEAVRQCNAVGGNGASPDTVAYLGWEWTQIGDVPENHWGHKNVVLRHLDDDAIPARPISAGRPPGAENNRLPGPWALGLVGAVADLTGSGGSDLIRYLTEMRDTPFCPPGPVSELAEGCIDEARTPEALFARLDEYGHEAMVIPHGTTWGYYTPAGSSWDKQLTAAQHDPDRQTLIEVHSGHGNSEEFRAWNAVEQAADGTLRCPAPSDDYLPSCWRAGEIIRERCLEDEESAEVCAARAAEARQNYLAAGVSGFLTVPGVEPAEWGDSGQCRDCFLPAFNYRPRNSAQYIMALSRPAADPADDPMRFRFGFIASSDNHSARPGTGYKEIDRTNTTEARFGEFTQSALSQRADTDPEPFSVPFDRDASPATFFGLQETERQGSFFLTGGLVAVHADGRGREAIWTALERREVYGTSGPRILLWFDLVDPRTGDRLPMGSAVRTSEAPTFQVRAVGSFEQQEGCGAEATASVSEERLAHLCGGECYHPSDVRRAIDRVEVVRIRPQLDPSESIADLIDDPWKVLPCNPDPAGCRVTFSDPEFAGAGRDAVYYVRAIEAPSPAVAADGVACLGVPYEEDCLGEVEERAWSSPIFVDHGAGG